MLIAVFLDVLTDSIAAVGLLIAFYYGLTGFACAWTFRRELHGRGLWTKGILPGLGGVMLLAAFVLSATSYASSDGGETTVFGVGGVFVIGIGALLLGAVLMVGYSRIAPSYFSGTTLSPPSAGPDGGRPLGPAHRRPAADDAPTTTIPRISLPGPRRESRLPSHRIRLPEPRAEGTRPPPKEDLFDPTR